MIILKMYQHKE